MTPAPRIKVTRWVEDPQCAELDGWQTFAVGADEATEAELRDAGDAGAEARAWLREMEAA